MSQDFFRLAIPEVGLSIERNTGDVPDDGKFHVLQQGNIVGSYPSLKRARPHFQKLKEEAGYHSQLVADNSAGQDLANKEHVERFLDAASSYWSQSHRYRSGGGRGGRGGV